MKITHKNGRTDSRYTVTLEYTGQVQPVYVARFCGEFLGWAIRDAGAWIKCADHKLQSLKVTLWKSE